ncbi:MAG: hypothetical protein LQ347_004958 [Umbilicaria vellea]|nr:MAG: hypothetical protein LQ347_004958 [Umbilicaria vellea]
MPLNVADRYADVFLTTMKPLQKVVTAQDVQSSLYYLHVDDPADDDLRAATYLSHGTEEPSDQMAYPLLGQKSPEAVIRKPLLPESSRTRTHQLELPPEAYPNLQSTSQGPQPHNQVGRKPVNSVSSRRTEFLLSSSVAPSGGLLGPRPFHQRLHSADSAAHNSAADHGNLGSRRWSEQPPALPCRPELRRKEIRSEQRIRGWANKSTQSDLGIENTLEQSHWRSLGKLTGQGYRNDGAGNNIDHTPSRKRDLSITLIRRDPGSGGQWNIGKILTGSSSQDDGSRECCDSKPTALSGHANSTINIEFTIPGYQKFTIANATDRSDSAKENRTDKEPAPPELRIQQDRVFRRELWTRSSASDCHSERSSPPADSDARRRSDPFRPSFGLRRASSANGENNKRRVSPDSRPPSIKDYTFQSPWNGLCEFTSGIAGRSLKCKHTLPNNSNPSAAVPQSATVSELRFNLPSSTIFRSKNSGSEASAKTATLKRSSVFSKHHTRTDSADGDEHNAGDEADRMDLSLGQEYAGGGFGGKAAKLGKLIVEDEGLKMLDLLVAANMGVWWRVWERGGG